MNSFEILLSFLESLEHILDTSFIVCNTYTFIIFQKFATNFRIQMQWL